MKRVSINKLSGGEILARDLYTFNYGSVLMPKGTILKKDYIEKLIALGIDTVFVEEEKKDSSCVRAELTESCQNQIRQVMERHIYKHNGELKKLCRLAEDMIMEAVNEEPYSEKIVEIQEGGTDLYTHCMQVCTLSTILALRCGLEREIVQDILKGALLHDIGLRYITVSYENVSVEGLSKIEREEYRSHTLEGYKALEKESWLSATVKDIIFYHHEMLDGSGYPLRLRGDKLSIPVKIVSVCDAFDERIRGIGYKRCHLQEALEFLRDNRGVLLDRELSEKFLNMIVQYPNGCVVKLSNGEIGKVVCQNREMPERPVLLLLKDACGMEYEERQELDLMKALNIFILEADKTPTSIGGE